MENEIFVREFEIPAISETLNLYQTIVGDVSCVVWDASIVLSKYLEKKFEESRDFLRDSRVLELGAGLGCVGLIAACLGARVVSSDLPDSIPLLDMNIAKNEHVWSKYGHIKSLALKWGEDNDLEIPDIILLADCIYYEESIQPLLKTLYNLSGAHTEVILCQEMRESEKQQKNWDVFMKSLKESFVVKPVPLTEQNEEYCSPDIILLRMKKK